MFVVETLGQMIIEKKKKGNSTIFSSLKCKIRFFSLLKMDKIILRCLLCNIYEKVIFLFYFLPHFFLHIKINMPKNEKTNK